MPLRISPGAPDLEGLDELGVPTFWAPADSTNFYAAESFPYAGARRRFIATCLHTPEEDADDVESTPAYFQIPNVVASTGYYGDSDGDIIQMVRDKDFAWAQGTRTVREPNTRFPRPSWWKPEYISYNTCMYSIEIEGRAASIGRTFVPGGPQFRSVAMLVAFLHHRSGIPVTREFIVAHGELATDRWDPGTGFPWTEFMAAVRQNFDMLNAPDEPLVTDKHFHTLKLAPKWKTSEAKYPND